jgi:TonB family protein
VSIGTLRRRGLAGVLLLGQCLAASHPLLGQEAMVRKIKSQSPPVYPELARRMSITGVVKIQLKVDKSGAVKEMKLVGGHPVLANAAMDAIRKWKYEPGPEDTTGIVEIRFTPNQ